IGRLAIADILDGRVERGTDTLPMRGHLLLGSATPGAVDQLLLGLLLGDVAGRLPPGQRDVELVRRRLAGDGRGDIGLNRPDAGAEQGAADAADQAFGAALDQPVVPVAFPSSNAMDGASAGADSTGLGG